MTDRLILKVLSAADWERAQAIDEVLAPVDVADGYVHFSTASQVQETLDKWFQGEEDAVLFAFDAQDFPDTLKWEASRNNELFPHVYGVVRPGQARARWTLKLGPSGAPHAPIEALEFQLG